MDLHFSKESSAYFKEASVQVSFLPFVKPEAEKFFPFHGKKKYFYQSKERMTLLKNFNPTAGWQNEKNVLAVCGPGWVQTHLKHFFPELTNDKSLMNFDEKENDPLLLNLVLVNLSHICFFSQYSEIA